MRTLTTVILRLLHNNHAPSLRGTLQTLDEPEPRAFKDECELLAHLRRIAALSHAGTPHPSEEDDLLSKGKAP